MSGTMSRVQRRAAFAEIALRAFEALEEWYDGHPDASFGEIEAEARRVRRGLMGEALGLLINGRDKGVHLEAPYCEKCGQPMRFEGYRRWGVSGLEGDTELVRAYYRCSRCSGETLFPPGWEAEAAEGSLE